ncbi:MAG: hypothetical protein V1774_03680 [Candidatus Eisenbacteria bacterium]
MSTALRTMGLLALLALAAAPCVARDASAVLPQGLFTASVLSAGTGGGEVPATAGGVEPAMAESEEAAQARLMALYEKMIQFNLDHAHTLKSGTIDSLMAQYAELPLGEKIAAWADYFWQRGDAVYLFGLADGGYVREGRLVDDFRTDCVLFFYRVTELGRSSSALEAVQFAFGTRFYGAILEDVVDAQGRVDYDSPVHLDYSIDMVRSGIWGQEITSQLGDVVADQAGSTRYAPQSISYLPKQNLDPARLMDGDIVYFISDESTAAGRALRDAGAMVGHIGVIKIERGEPQLIHAAARGLDGLYVGGKVEKLPLQTYLARVENFKGLLATRIENF